MRTILSVCDTEYKANRPYSLSPLGPFNVNFVLPANKKGGHSTCQVSDMYANTHIREGMYQGMPDSALNIATDIIGEWTLYSAIPSPGILLCKGDDPTAEEIAQAERMHETRCAALRNLAFNLWANNKRDEATQPLYRNASIYLDHPEDPWVMAQKSQPMENCPWCGQSVPAGVANCYHCGKIVNFDRAAQLEAEYQKALAKVANVAAVPQIPKPQARA